MGLGGTELIDRVNTVWNGHDVDGILAMMTDDVVFEASFGKDIWGTRVTRPPAVSDLLQGMCTRIPDICWDEIRHYVHTDVAVVEWITSGTPHGGSRYEVYGCDVLALRDGRISAKRSFRKGVI